MKYPIAKVDVVSARYFYLSRHKWRRVKPKEIKNLKIENYV